MKSYAVYCVLAADLSCEVPQHTSLYIRAAKAAVGYDIRIQADLSSGHSVRVLVWCKNVKAATMVPCGCHLVR